MVRSAAKRKLTVLIDPAVASELRAAVERGDAASQGELVERAVRLLARERRMAELRRRYEAAANDPEFVGEIEEVLSDFEPADTEASGRGARAPRRDLRRQARSR